MIYITFVLLAVFWYTQRKYLWWKRRLLEIEMNGAVLSARMLGSVAVQDVLKTISPREQLDAKVQDLCAHCRKKALPWHIAHWTTLAVIVLSWICYFRFGWWRYL